MDKTVALVAAKDLAVYQGIQVMNNTESVGEPIESDISLSDDELAYKQAKERGELTQDELAYFEYKGFNCDGISVVS